MLGTDREGETPLADTLRSLVYSRETDIISKQVSDTPQEHSYTFLEILTVQGHRFVREKQACPNQRAEPQKALGLAQQDNTFVQPKLSTD